MRFESPWLLLLLVLVPVVGVLLAWRKRSGVRFSSVALTEPVPPSLRVQTRWLPGVLRVVAVALLVVAAARPQFGTGQTITRANGVAIIGVVDRSYSMASPMVLGGEQVTRLEAVKRVFTEFVTGTPEDERGRRLGESLEGRPHDLVGLITFAAYPEMVVPLTRIHDPVVELVDRVELVPERSMENRTAIGDGLALAAARLQRAEEEIAQRDDFTGAASDEFTIKSKVIVLLTDGDENFGDIPMREAAELCAQTGVKVYAIGIGGYSTMIDPITGQQVRVPARGFDERRLRALAGATDGRYWGVDDADALRGVYAEIDDLETTEIEAVDYTTYDERFAIPALAALVLLVAELVLRVSVYRRLP